MTEHTDKVELQKREDSKRKFRSTSNSNRYPLW
jgi:hypothetical protein